MSLLGATGKSDDMIYGPATQRIIGAMKAVGVRRLIATATPSVSDPLDRFSLPFSLAVVMIKLLAGKVYLDLTALGRAVRTSGLDWTLIRLPFLTSEPSPHPAIAGYIGDKQIKLFSLSRDGLADFLVGQLTDKHWLQKSPVLSNV